jgi:hypothetical protein
MTAPTGTAGVRRGQRTGSRAAARPRLAMEIQRYRQNYNTIRPHQAVGDRTQRQAAAHSWPPPGARMAPNDVIAHTQPRYPNGRPLHYPNVIASFGPGKHMLGWCA